jgi:hypothetical protein
MQDNAKGQGHTQCRVPPSAIALGPLLWESPCAWALHFKMCKLQGLGGGRVLILAH